MRESTPLIIYVVVMILGSIIKRLAEEQARKRKGSVQTGEIESHDVTLEDMLRQDTDVGEDISPNVPYMSMDIDIEEREEVDDGWDDEWQRAYQPNEDVQEDVGVMPRRTNWAQAIVMTEIIREPRAKRRWPAR